MAPPLLTTKLYVPPLRKGFVPRPRLLERLNEGLHRRLVLVSAPAGFGKTTLLSEWLAARHKWTIEGDHPPSAAWLSLDAEDNDLARFLRYLIAALAPMASEIEQEAGELLRLPQLPATEIVLTILINELCSLPGDLVLVLEDYHVIETGSIHNALTFLLENLPPQVHLIVSTRVDPPLPLSRWRSRGMMVEIYADDLRFTHQETLAYLNDVMNLQLSPEDVTALSHRTEGWIVGLQMAALALQSKSRPQDASTFVQAFSGSHHYIMDYLMEEVFAHQPAGIQTFLLQTSILSRLTGSLCDAVTGREDSHEILAALDRANLFLVPLDGERCWYRYHHLFAEVLRARLLRSAGRGAL